MRRTLTFVVRAAFVIALSVTASATLACADTYVNGNQRSDGTQVQPHYRSAPDGNPYNNYSYPGNTNPHTGKVAPGNPDTYLKDYNAPGSLGGSPARPRHGLDND